MSTPAGLMDFVCPSATSASAQVPFNSASASVLEKEGYKPVSEAEGLKGPLRAVQVCGNCDGDGSAQDILLFYGNRYVGMVPERPRVQLPEDRSPRREHRDGERAFCEARRPRLLPDRGDPDLPLRVAQQPAALDHNTRVNRATSNA